MDISLLLVTFSFVKHRSISGIRFVAVLSYEDCSEGTLFHSLPRFVIRGACFIARSSPPAFRSSPGHPLRIPRSY